ncbi:kinase-like protein, partial [Auricularia subglabra TFB-10046 SS5]
HRYILPFVGVLSTQLYTVLVSGFMENGDMLKYLKTHPAVDRGSLILQVAVAVDHLHRREGIVHGDLKCENVLISPDGDAQLADFGFSTPVEKPSGEDTTTTAIRVSNTLRFAAPELLLDEAKSSSGRTRSKTPQADVYAFGMLILQVRVAVIPGNRLIAERKPTQVFSGARPWRDLNDQAVVLKVSQGGTHPRLANATAAGLTDPWWALCRGCWKHKPEERPTMQEVVSRIRSVRATLCGVPVVTDVHPDLGHYRAR